jgi:hypothetical protein
MDFVVSTDHQGVNGNGMAAQRKAVEDYLNGGRWKLVGEFTEVESGKRSDRPKLEKALTACRKHKAKLVIAKLDRLSRNVHFISGLMERKVDFVACDMPSANRPSEWRDVQHLDQAVGHYIISDRPLSETEWEEQRCKVIESKPNESDASLALPSEAISSEKPNEDRD